MKRDCPAQEIDLNTGYSISSSIMQVCSNSVKDSVSTSSVILSNKQHVCHIDIVRMRTGSDTNTGNLLTFLIFCLFQLIVLQDYKT